MFFWACHGNAYILLITFTGIKDKWLGFWGWEKGGSLKHQSFQWLSHIWLFWNPMDCSIPGFSVHHQLREVTQTHVHRVGDAIQTSHPLSSSSPPAFYLSHIRVISNKSVLHIRWPNYCSFSCSINPSNEHWGLISFRMDGLDLLQSKGLSSVFSNTSVQKHPFFGVQLSL